MVSELLHGRTLRAELKGARLPLRRTLDYALQIARDLASAHARGVVHRDLKPENIYVAEAVCSASNSVQTAETMDMLATTQNCGRNIKLAQMGFWLAIRLELLCHVLFRLNADRFTADWTTTADTVNRDKEPTEWHRSGVGLGRRSRTALQEAREERPGERPSLAIRPWLTSGLGIEALVDGY